MIQSVNALSPADFWNREFLKLDNITQSEILGTFSDSGSYYRKMGDIMDACGIRFHVITICQEFLEEFSRVTNDLFSRNSDKIDNILYN